MLRISVVLFFVIFSAASLSTMAAEVQDKPLKVLVAYEVSEYYPWTMPSGEGVDFMLMREVGKQLGVDFEFVCLPWPECLKRLKSGKVDALLNASYNSQRAEYCCYPMRGNDLEVDFRTHYDGYSLYRVKGAEAQWVGGKLKGYEGKVAAQNGFSVINDLKKAGVEVADHYITVQEIFDDMQKGKIIAAALMPITADYILENNKSYDKIEKLPQQICFKPYFLVFSRNFYQVRPKLTWNIWERIGHLRSSSMYGQWINQVTSAKESPRRVENEKK